MYRELIYSASDASQHLVSAMEDRVGVKLPESFKEFCLKYNDAKLKDAEILAKKSNLGQSSYGLREFLGTQNVGALEIECWNDTHIAFAEDAFGNFFVFNKIECDAVYFLDHETGQVEFVADSFEDFLSNIVKADYGDLPIDKDAEVWIDPSFLKLQKDLGNA